MVKALIFDVFGTVVDWRTGISTEVEAYFASQSASIDGIAFAEAWRGRYQPAMEPIRTGQRPYTALDILHRENLDATLDEFDLGEMVGENDRIWLARAWERLPAWPDCPPGLHALKKNFAIAPCSNGSIALMTWLGKHADLPWDVILGAEVARDYKPQPAVYLRSAEALGLSPEETMMVAAHNEDLGAARRAGLKTAFVARPNEYGPGQTRDLAPSEDWDVVASDFVDLADQMGKA